MNRRIICEFVCGIFILIALDYLWLGILAVDFYKEELNTVLRMRDGEMVPIWWSAFFVYPCISFGIVWFTRTERTIGVCSSLWSGAAFGFCSYGIYEFTNYSIVEGWTLAVVWKDILWGGVLCGCVNIALHLVFHRKRARA
jgi:uncharacterized membrane protein